jgi:hypothetical protein
MKNTVISTLGVGIANFYGLMYYSMAVEKSVAT